MIVCDLIRPEMLIEIEVTALRRSEPKLHGERANFFRGDDFP
jgi:hypothetical protein